MRLSEVFPKHLYYGYILLIALAPFVGYISMHYFDIAYWNLMAAYVFVTAGLFLLKNINSNPLYLKLFFLFFIYRVLSDALIVGEKLDLKYFYQQPELLVLLSLILIVNIKIDKRIFTKISKINEYIIMIAFIVILLQQFVNTSFFIPQNKAHDLIQQGVIEQRFPSIYIWIGDFNVLGLSFMPILALIVSKYYKELNRKKYILYILIGAVVAFISKSRFIILQWLIILLMIAKYHKFSGRIFIKLLSILILCMLLIIFVLPYFGLESMNIIENRILEKSKGGVTEVSASTRLLAFRIFWELFPDKPILGYGNTRGIENMNENLINLLAGRSSQIHVGYLSVFYYYGIVGGLIYWAAVFLLLKNIYNIAKATNEWGPFYGFLMYPANELTGVYMNIIQMGTIMCIIFAFYFKKNLNYITNDQLNSKKAENLNWHVDYAIPIG